MSNESKSVGDSMNDLMRLWLDMAARTTETAEAFAGATASPEGFRQGRSDVFKMWSDYWEHFLRSAAFLDSQKQSMTGSLELREQIRDFLTRWNHELQLASSQDVDQLMLAMRRLGDGLSEQLEQVASRLDKLDGQVAAIGKRLGAPEPKRQQRGAGRRKPKRIDRTT